LDSARLAKSAADSSTFIDNMRLPVHRWFRYSAGFSAAWVETVIAEHQRERSRLVVLDPFAGSGTTLLAAEQVGVEAIGYDAHPFIVRVTRAKLASGTDPQAFLNRVQKVRKAADCLRGSVRAYPDLIRRCYDDSSLASLDRLRQAIELEQDDTPSSELVWLALVAILRRVSSAGTAQWQYVLPKKHKRLVLEPMVAFDDCCTLFFEDMQSRSELRGPRARMFQGDARSSETIPPCSANLVITSPPYPNNFDYADATRLEMSFFGEVASWGDLHDAVRRYLVRSCSQHVPERAVDLEATLAAPELAAIRAELASVCEELAHIRLSKGGKKNYHLMIASYFLDLAQVWRALRIVTSPGCRVCFVIGDSAPYGVYVPVVPWMGALALQAGFASFTFEKTRDRNIKWKNRKHRVPLKEGRLWVEG
jgi:hypothetical protein